MTFWALSMYDLYVPLERYDQELTKLKQQLAQLDDNKDMVCYVNGSFRPRVDSPEVVSPIRKSIRPVVLKAWKKVREKTCGSIFSSENFTQIISKIDTIAAVHVDFMYRAAHVHSFSISNVIIEIAWSFLISLVADYCLPSGESTYVQAKQLCANRFSGETNNLVEFI